MATYHNGVRLESQRRVCYVPRHPKRHRPASCWESPWLATYLHCDRHGQRRLDLHRNHDRREWRMEANPHIRLWKPRCDL